MSQYVENIIQEKMDKINSKGNVYEVGRVIGVTDYIVEVSGLIQVSFNEKVVIAGHSIGYVSLIRRNSILVSVLQSDNSIFIGDEVIATGEPFHAKFSPSSMSHIVDIFGTDRMCDEVFDDCIDIEVENPTIPIMDRRAVCRPLETGIAGVDLIYPIGKGQRQLIIGDKKTGKTQIALDAIANQKGKDVICIYVPIGKVKKNVKAVYQELQKRGAMDYTIILAALNDDLPPALFLTPYVAASIAEYYMMQGKDVLVVFDDLKRHANVHREISLLSGKVPGRDAYPPDIFYVHSRLLERGCQHKCGGSITMLPIVETKGGDITGYISTNIISITDGQLVMSKKNFDKGEKPAIQYGLSVSRLGGAVQEKEVKKLGARVRRELLSYLDTREVYELANVDEMAPEMKKKLFRGADVLKGLKQYKFAGRTPEEMIDTFTKIMDE